METRSDDLGLTFRLALNSGLFSGTIGAICHVDAITSCLIQNVTRFAAIQSRKSHVSFPSIRKVLLTPLCHVCQRHQDSHCISDPGQSWF